MPRTIKCFYLFYSSNMLVFHYWNSTSLLEPLYILGVLHKSIKVFYMPPAFWRSNTQRTGSAIIAGMWRFNRSLNSCVDQILELDGSRMQKELAQMYVSLFKLIIWVDSATTSALSISICQVLCPNAWCNWIYVSFL